MQIALIISDFMTTWNYNWQQSLRIQLRMNTKVIFRSSHQEVFLEKRSLKIYRKLTGKHPCRSVISIKLQSNFIRIILRHGYLFIEITLQHGCSPVDLLLFFRTPFTKNTPGRMLLDIIELKNLCVKYSIKIFMGNLNINSITNKFDLLSSLIQDKIEKTECNIS